MPKPSPASPAAGGAFYAPPRRRTIWQRLGFGRARAPRPEADEYLEGFAPSWFVVGTYCHLDWRDRLRVLISGNLHVEQAVKTDVLIGRSRAHSAVSVLPPGKRRAA